MILDDMAVDSFNEKTARPLSCCLDKERRDKDRLDFLVPFHEPDIPLGNLWQDDGKDIFLLVTIKAFYEVIVFLENVYGVSSVKGFSGADLHKEGDIDDTCDKGSPDWKVLYLFCCLGCDVFH